MEFGAGARLAILRSLILAIGFFGFALSGWADDWYLVATSANGDSYFVDVAQLTTSGNVTKAWVREDLKDPKFVSLLKSRVWQYLDNNIVDCSGNRFATSVRYSRDAKGSVVDSYIAANNTLQYSDIPPGSIAVSIVKFVCGRGKLLASEIANHKTPATPGNIKNQDWRPFASTSDDDKIFIAIDDISPGTEQFAGLVFFYQRWDYIKPQTIGLMEIKSRVTLMSANCANGNLASLASANFDQKGQLLFRTDFPSAPEPTQPAAGSIGASSVELACAQAAKQSHSPSLTSTETNGATTVVDGSRDANLDNLMASGTAWYVDSGYFVTAQHVIDGAQEVYIGGADKTPLKAIVVAADAKNDVAVLRADVRDRKLRPMTLAKGTTPLGSRVFTIGYPHIDYLGTSPKITSGEVSGKLPLDPTKLLISVPVQSGNSGGPLINMNGEVVGLVIEKLRADKMLETTGDLTENVNFALKAKYIDALLDDLPKLQTAIQPSKPKPSSIEDIVAMYKNSIFLVFTVAPGTPRR